MCGQLPSSTMEICHCREWWIGHKALYIPQLYTILLVDRLLHWYGETQIRLHATSDHCWVCFYVLFWNMSSGPYFWWVQLQHRGGPTGVCVAAGSQPGAYWIKCPSFGSIWIRSHRHEVFVKPWIAVVVKVTKMITKSGMSWGIYCTLQVIMESLTVTLHILLKFYLSGDSCKLQGILTVPQFAVSL